ncbi:MAG: hypothetical protein JWR85_4232 [Marmoricola sp.]|nr:hypothetical protein [Marmoricola sp.]
MAVDIQRTLDFGSARRIINLPNAASAQEPATLSQLQSAIEGIAWKDNVRVRAPVNITIATPGANIDGIAMAANDRFLAPNQTTTTENGIYIWNGAAVPATRALDANTFDELESAVVTVDEGTSAGVTYRQSAVNGVIGTNAPVFTTFGTAAAAASETVSGVAELATQAETDAGADDARIVTPLKLATSPFATKKFNANIGDASATSIAVNHNLNTRDVEVEVYRNSGNFDSVIAEIQRTTVNQVTIVFDTAPAVNAYRVMVRA